MRSLVTSPQGPKFWGVQCSDMYKTTNNELFGIENGVIGTKMRSLVLIVCKLDHFTHFYRFRGPFWPKFGVTDFWRGLKVVPSSSPYTKTQM